MTPPDLFATPTGPVRPGSGSRPPSPASDAPREATVAAIRSAVCTCVAAQEGGPESLRRCARLARADGVKPERLVMLIHTAFDDFGDAADAVEDSERRRLDLSNIALDAYFADE